MSALIITPLDKRKPFIVDFDPSKESQEDVERRLGVSFSEHHESRALSSIHLSWYSGTDCF